MQPVTLDKLKAVRLDLRGARAKVNWKIARQIRQEILNVEFEAIEHLHSKINILAHFYFVRSQAGRLRELLGELELRVPRSYWDQTCYKYLVMMRQFELAADLAKSCLDTSITPDPFLRLHLEATLLTGEAEKSVKVAEKLLQADWRRLDQMGKRRVFNLLVQSGKSQALNATDAADAGVPDILDRAKHLMHSTDQTIPILCISLDRDYRRLNATRNFMPVLNKFIHSKALLGSTLPRSVLDIGGIPNKHRTDAEIGCSLSHMKAWETVSRICNDNEYALIMEDDARFIYGPGYGLSKIVEKANAISAGLVFINDRSSQQLRDIDSDEEFELIPLDSFESSLEASKTKRGPGWGADGYLINGKTAKYLSKIWLEVGLDGALDWQLYLMGQKDLSQVRMAPRYRGSMESLKVARANGSDDYFYKGFVSELSIITTTDYGYSTIDSGNL